MIPVTIYKMRIIIVSAPGLLRGLNGKRYVMCIAHLLTHCSAWAYKYVSAARAKSPKAQLRKVFCVSSKVHCFPSTWRLLWLIPRSVVVTLFQLQRQFWTMLSSGQVSLFEFSSHLFNHIIHDRLLLQGTSSNKFEAGKTFVAGNTLEEIQISLPLWKFPLISITTLLIWVSHLLSTTIF